MKRVLFAVLFAAVSTSAFAQSPTNTGSPTPGTGYQYWPIYPPVGIGTEGYGGPVNAALQLHYSDSNYTKPAVLRFSQSSSTGSAASGVLALIPQGTSLQYPNWLHLSSLITGQDFVFRANHGDLILTNNWQNANSGAIRLATRPITSLLLAGTLDTDYERMTILNNGNVGINMPHDSAARTATPKDQLQIGGGSFDVQGSRIPGLTIYGGHQFEGMDITPGHPMITDWRYIAFNKWCDHYDTTANRFHRIAPISSSSIGFADVSGGLLELDCWPHATGEATDNFDKSMSLRLSGTQGLTLWYKTDTVYHVLFDACPPGYHYGDMTRNLNGLFYHRTPVYIGGADFVDFTNFAHVNPDMGDNKTWQLVVDGPELAKEVFVLDTVWSDFVFQPNYKLPSLGEVEQYTKAHHHLEGIPSASEVAKNGISLGATEAKLLQKIEEITLYTISLQKEVDALKAEVQVLNNRKEK